MSKKPDKKPLCAVEIAGAPFEFDPGVFEEWATARLVAKADGGDLASVVALIDHVMGGQADAVAAAIEAERGRCTVADMQDAFVAVAHAAQAEPKN